MLGVGVLGFGGVLSISEMMDGVKKMYIQL